MQTDPGRAASRKLTAPFSLTIPPLKMLTSKEDLAFARAAFARHPEDVRLRRGLVDLLLQGDHFDEAHAVLQEHPGEDARDLRQMFTVLLSRERPEDDQLAVAVCERALHASVTPQQRAEVLADYAKALRRVGQHARAKELLVQALADNPQDKDAYKRMFQHLLDVERDVEAALEFAESSIASGVVHARSLGAWVLALAKLGRLEEARRAEGAGEFLLQTYPAPPAGWESAEAFDAALTAEALSHPDMRYDRYGTASARTWRLDEPAVQRTKVFPQLQKLVQREVERYVASLSAVQHPFAAAVPPHAKLRNWCVITEGDGYETYHVHQNGWLSGVYYIHVQDHIANGTGPEGCIAFGLPDFLIGEEAARAYGERIVRPRSGLMMIFPSHVYHRTFPHHGEGRRICYAFDIIPVAEPATSA